MVSRHQLHSNSSHWHHVHFDANGIYDKTWFFRFYNKHKYIDNQFFLDANEHIMFLNFFVPDTLYVSIKDAHEGDHVEKLCNGVCDHNGTHL